MVSKRRALTALVAGVMAVGLTACGTGPAADSKAAENEIIAFLPSSATPFLGVWQKQMKEQAKELGYSVKIYENPFSQADLDKQVQTVVRSGEKPTAFVYWPNDPKAGLVSMKALKDTGVPVVIPDQKPTAEAEGLYDFYVGNDDERVGRQAAEGALEALAELEQNGVELGPDGGNIGVVTFPAGYGSNEPRLRSFEEALDGKAKVIDVQPAGHDAPSAYKATAAMVAKNRSEGIHLVYAFSNGLATGVAQSLTEAGYAPGTDVMVIAGSCSGTDSDMKSKTTFSTTMLHAGIEGQLTMLAIDRFFKHDKVVLEGSNTEESSADAVPESAKSGPVYKTNFIPMPLVRNTEMESVSVWGKSFADGCAYA